MKDIFLTKVDQDDLDDASELDDYLYDFSGYNRLLRCASMPDEGSFYCGKYDFSGVKIICDNACDDNTVSFMSESVPIEVDLPNGITHLGSNVFKGRRLDSVSIPESLEYIGESPFALTSPFRLKSKSKRFVISDNCLIDNEKSSIIHNVSYSGYIEIPSSLTRIESYSFSRLQGTPHVDSFYRYLKGDELKEKTISLVIPGSIDYIGDNAFENCNIREIIFLGVPQSIGNNVFKGCNLLSKIYVPFGEKKRFSASFPNECDIIDDSGYIVQKYLQRNLLAVNGITDFKIINLANNKNIYGYIKDNSFHVSNESGVEIDRKILSDNSVIVIKKSNEHYTLIQSKEYFSCKSGEKIFAVYENGNIEYISGSFYIRLESDNIIVHGVERKVKDNFYTNEKEHTAQFIGAYHDIQVKAIDDNWHYFKNNNGYRLISDDKILPEVFDDLQPICRRQTSGLPSLDAILVLKNGLWGWYKKDGGFVAFKYKTIKTLLWDLLLVKDEQNLLGVVSFEDKTIIDFDNKYLTIREQHSSPLVLVAFSSKYVYSVFVSSNLFSKGSRYTYSSYWGELKHPEEEIDEFEIADYYKYTRYRDEEMKFFTIKYSNGDEEYFDQYCNSYNWSQFCQWNEKY